VIVVKTVEALRQEISQQKRQDKCISFVPTMGNLHQGHLKLIKLARQKSDFVVASIFVNPLQFGQGEDFDNYPRTHESDIKKLNDENCDLLFLPSVETMYPNADLLQTLVEVPRLSDMLCGESRPGHFNGVSTVVCKLFNLVQPNVAIFGEKDFQQLMVIRRMVADLCMPIEIVGASIVRENDGLAMSSRNGYLDDEQRKLAPKIYSQLKLLADELLNGMDDYSRLEKKFSDQLNQLGFETDYIAIRRSRDLLPPDKDEKELIILIAAFLGKTRLIDNLVLT